MCKCCNGNHTLEEVYEERVDSSISNLVQWCSNCGAIVVDVVIDGRVSPGAIMKMKLPKIILGDKND